MEKRRNLFQIQIGILYSFCFVQILLYAPKQTEWDVPIFLSSLVLRQCVYSLDIHFEFQFLFLFFYFCILHFGSEWYTDGTQVLLEIHIQLSRSGQQIIWIYWAELRNLILDVLKCNFLSYLLSCICNFYDRV